MTKLIVALALIDIAAHGVKAGQLLEAQPDTIKALEKQGQVDPHKDAVAHARDQGQKPVRSAIEAAAEALAAKADALRVRIAELEALEAKAEDPATKAALAGELKAKQAELADLG